MDYTDSVWKARVLFLQTDYILSVDFAYSGFSKSNYLIQVVDTKSNI